MVNRRINFISKFNNWGLRKPENSVQFNLRLILPNDLECIYFQLIVFTIVENTLSMDADVASKQRIWETVYNIWSHKMLKDSNRAHVSRNALLPFLDCILSAVTNKFTGELFKQYRVTRFNVKTVATIFKRPVWSLFSKQFLPPWNKMLDFHSSWNFRKKPNRFYTLLRVVSSIKSIAHGKAWKNNQIFLKISQNFALKHGNS